MEMKEVLIDENEINFKIRDKRRHRQGLNPTRNRKGTDFSKGLVQYTESLTLFLI